MQDTDLTRGPDDMDLPDQTGMSDEEAAAEELGMPGDEEEPCCDSVEVEMMQATATVLGSVTTVDLDASTSIIGTAGVEGDADISTSIVGVIKAGSAGLYQGCAGAIVSEYDAAVEQGYASVLVARAADIERSGAGVVVAGEANIARSWVGMMAARNATLRDGSRVIIDAKAALIIGALLFGGLGLLAAAIYLGAHRVAARIPRLPWTSRDHGRHLSGAMARLPHLQLPDLPKLPDLGSLADVVAKLRHAG